MDKVNRVKISYFRPLVMAAILKTSAGEPARLQLLRHIERFIFVHFRLCRSQANSGSSHFYLAAREVYMNGKPPARVMDELDDHLAWVFDKNQVFKTSYFSDFIAKKFSKNGPGFYGWSDLRYFLFEYEEHLKASRGQAKLGWSNFIKSDGDKISIEHVYPQTADSAYWSTRFGAFTPEQQHALLGSLGNLLPLSSRINSALQ